MQNVYEFSILVKAKPQISQLVQFFFLVLTLVLGFHPRLFAVPLYAVNEC